jgi:hypothetical protein
MAFAYEDILINPNKKIITTACSLFSTSIKLYIAQNKLN